MGFEIIVVGSCNVDYVNYVERFPKPGETMPGISFEMAFGGKGANQAVMATLLGGNVLMIGKLGNDYMGRAYLDHLKEIGLKSDGLKMEPNISTGIATIIVNREGNNSIILTPGANSLVDSQYVEISLKDHLDSAKVLLVQMEINMDATLTALKLAKMKKVITILNTAPVCKGITTEFYQNTDILCCNEIEIEQLTGVHINEKTLTDIKTAKLFFDNGCSYVIVTLGADGAVLFDKNTNVVTKVPITIEIDHVVDTTGGGDAFLGALAYLINEKLKLKKDGPVLTKDIVSRSVNYATLTVTKKGAQSSYKVLGDRTNQTANK